MALISVANPEQRVVLSGHLVKAGCVCGMRCHTHSLNHQEKQMLFIK